ncbi:ATP-dependent DNA helicase RRM3-like [Gastrolobium bilobum]|uniref:ATP-dependent DNA helicase RRM3-like n=1 Tax=Gastrolobium bilobum TaxID=150636 RepID=UPI002AB1833B|nr:ATP-dependent DNA helicase RRM3-like [Gastrolobium bilobum]
MYDRFALEEEHKRLINSLTDEQKAVYDKIVSAVTAGNGGLFFLYGFGGTGKTFIWNTLSASIRSKAGIVLNVASSEIASLLLPGGRTTHSRFRIPIQINEDSTCNIRPKSTIAELLSKTKLIIWDEAPMVHRFFFKALDRTLRDVLRISDTSCADMPFGGKVVVLGGDFREILPVIPHGSRQDIVHATINSSHLWSHCHLLTLTKNMRLNSGSSAHNLEEIKEFSEWLLKVGDGNLGDDVDGESIITIPDELLIRESEDPLLDMVNFVYPNLLDNILDQTFFKERAILTPKLSDVAMLNEHLMSMIPGEERTFLSSDKILKQGGTSSVEDDEITPEILNTLSCSGIPDNKLILKVKVPAMLLRNIDQSRDASSMQPVVPPPSIVVATGAPPRRQRSFCTHCKTMDHTKDKCFKLHGYPPGYKPKPTRLNPILQSNTAILSISDSHSSSSTFTPQQYQQLLSLVSQHPNPPSLSSQPPSSKVDINPHRC